MIWMINWGMVYFVFAGGFAFGIAAMYVAMIYYTHEMQKINFNLNKSPPKYNYYLCCEYCTKLKMSGSAAMLAKFDAAAMAAQAKEWEAEVADEEKLAAQLSMESADKLAAAKAAYEKHHKFVEAQLAHRMKVRADLEAKIAANKAAEAADEEYHAFINSPEYCEFCQNVRDVAALDYEIDSLLLAEQRKGRPPVAPDAADADASTSATSCPNCDCCTLCPEDCGPDCSCLACEGEATDGEAAEAAADEADEAEEASSPLEGMSGNPLVV